MREDILKLSHDHKVAGHFKTKKTIDRVRNNYYWSGYRNDIDKWCKKCDLCSARKGPNRKNKAGMQNYKSGEPMQRIAIDIIGPLPKTDRGNQYILVLVTTSPSGRKLLQYLTKSPTVANTLVEEFICRYGIPSEIHTDQGRQFEAKLFQELCRLLEINKTRTTPYYPQSDGMIERFNRTLEAMLALVVAPANEIGTAGSRSMLSYRSAIHESTGYSPFEILMGRRASIPVTLLTEKPDMRDQANTYCDYVERLESRLEKVHQSARNHLDLTNVWKTKTYDRNSSLRSYQEGDNIWLYEPKRKKGISPKFQKSWIGPGKILKKISDVTYRVQMGPLSKPKIVHHNKLLPYDGRNPPTWK
ncbi:Retrovirus-related Pol polyprotein from transposon [Apostichopus japonicus]|uniref:Retrovirus-related Pol polyprotein from transposon n=1 Tax=Stichopus japonicus TaxID=307972 RepID=A0A2G8LLH1_STIJA|nr:Retrovirus-related Pol polyprotein from transposon [Apostichopus japonicus]